MKVEWGGSSDDKRNLEEGRFKATGKKVGPLSAFAGIGSCEAVAAKLGVDRGVRLLGDRSCSM